MATKLGKLVTYDKVKEPKPKKANISSFRRCRITKICRVLTYGEMKPIINSSDSDHVITRSYVSNWKLISPLRQGLYHQNWQGGDLWWQKATHGVTWLFDYAVLPGHMKNLKRNISSSTRPMDTKYGWWRGLTQKTKWLLII